MLKFFPTRVSDCQKSSRRQFLLQIGALAPLGLTLPTLLAQSAQAAGERRDVNCILIWTRGGTSHHETFDPKPEASDDVRGEFGVTQTTVPGVVFSDQLPNFARELGLFSVMRNLNPKNGSHGAADAYMMSGHKMNPAITYPCYGSVVSKERGGRENLPAYVQLGTNVDRRFGGGVAGYLGIAHNPFELPSDPSKKNFKVRDVTPPAGVDLARVSRRRQALAAIDTLQRDVEQQADAFNAIDQYYQSAFDMIMAPNTQRAFDLNREPDTVRDRYGRHHFGQSCLLARRLIESGVRFVTVTSGGWDTHRNNFSGLKKLLPPVDQGLPVLVRDLKQRGMLDNTLVVWLTDFGRTPIINSAAGRDHWSSAGMACFAGAGCPGGAVIGQTDETGAKPVGGEYYPEDIAATIYSKLGISLDTVHANPDGRPQRLCEGQPIPELIG